MSTRSLVRFAKREEGVSFSEHPERVEVQVYKHYDGYPSGHPVELAEFLKDFKIVNGIPFGYNDSKMANGLGCLAAQYVAAFKMGPGDLCVENPDKQHGDIEYITYVWGIEDKDIWISIFEDGSGFIDGEEQCIFVGKPQELIDKYEYND